MVLIAFGNRVMCVDVLEWHVEWPNLKFVKCDLLESDISLESFNVIACVSTIER
jgi:hypothetical protein